MFEPTVLETSALDQREKIWLLYAKGDLTPEVATVQLLRLDIDRLEQSRKTIAGRISAN